MSRFVSCFFLLFVALTLTAQQKYHQSNMLSVTSQAGLSYSNPFGGGVQFPLFGSIDLDFDGRNDLVVLDRSDDRLLTFINISIDQNIKFKYQPQYEQYLPQLTRTFILRDYNRDGLPDIFAFSLKNNTGLEVYQNVSSNNKLKFKKVVDPLLAEYWSSSKSLIYVNSLDLPAIEDVDGDGDDDLVTFFSLGTFVDYFENLSMDNYGVPDSLDFIYMDQCWGKFRESDVSNEVELGVSCSPVRIKRRHVGSTLLLLDMDADEDMDVFLGDIQYPGVLFLKNGKKEYNYYTDSMIEQHLNFITNHPVNIKNMPGLYYIDLNNDGVKDLIAAPLDEEIIDTFQTLNQVWIYKNKGQNNQPDFEFVKDDFLQEHMIDLGGPTNPVFFDYDADGDLDIIVASWGNFDETYYQHDRLWVFENVGGADTPSFKIVDDDYLNLSQKSYQNLSPCFEDIDGDGDKDLIMGQENGCLVFYKNIAAAGQIPNFLFVDNFFDSIDVGSKSVPAVKDINKDGFPDLVIGEKNGNLNYYQNTGNQTTLDFEFKSDTFGGIEIPDSKLPSLAPVFYDLDKNGYYDLILGSREEGLIFYPDIEKAPFGNFEQRDILFYDSLSSSEINKPLGSRLKPAIMLLDGDSIPDIILGSSRGGLLLYGSQFDSISLSIDKTTVEQSMEVKVFPNPCRNYFNIKLEGGNLHREYEFTLFDLYGHVLLKKKISASEPNLISVEQFRHGIYIAYVLDIKSGAGFFAKMIKQ